MNAAVVKKTQDALGKVIKKPPLTEKLLSKPPFRYLHDIFSEIIRTTGFMKGLYKDSELKSDNVKDKETKIAFLQKAIDVVILVSGEPLAAKPARIVAGHEPEKTNELLQAIAKCCLNKLPSEEAVKRVLSGEKVDLKTKATSKSQDKENREGREHQSSEREKRIERSGSREDKDPGQPRERERQRRDGERDQRRDREHSGKNQRREQDHDKSRERTRDKDKGRGKDRDKEKEKDLERHQDKSSRDRDGMRERDSHRDPERSKDKRRERDKEAERRKDSDDKNTSKERDSKSKDRLSEIQQKPTEDEPRKAVKPAPVTSSQSDSPARIPRPSSAKGQRRKPRIAGQDESDSEADADPPKEGGDPAGASFPSEMNSSNKRPARPSSARPAPPRVKKQENFPEGVPAERLSSAKSSVIRDGRKRSDDEDEEDEQFLVAEAAPEAADAHEKKESAQDLAGDEEHGGLVKKILETKKDYEASPSSIKSKEPVSEEARKKEQDLVTREVERLRASIQSVCQSALPLGKIMDYVQEDIDAMQAELQGWRRENKEHAQALLQEQEATERALEPLKAELYELDQMIKDYQDKICAMRSNILRNEEKIQKKLTGIITSST
ncbi:TRAF3-interacting protein 1 isoform X2 [Festucalex cinctus]